MASSFVVFVSALVVFLAAGSEESVWGPADGVRALDEVEKAVDAIIAAPGLSADQLKQAKKVAEDVKATCKEVEGNQKLSKAEAKAKVGNALQELMNLQNEFTQPASDTDKKSKLAALQKQLSEKKQALEKEEAMINLLTLQKQLAEKKLELQKLMEKKNGAGATKKSQVEDASEEEALVSKLVKVSDNLHATDAGKQLSKPLQEAVADVEARAKKVSASIEKIEAVDKKAEGELDAASKKQFPTMGKDDPMKKEQAMLRVLKKEEHRKFMKATSLKRTELAELKEVEASIQKGDEKGLKSVLTKMQGQVKVMSAKSGNFLH